MEADLSYYQRRVIQERSAAQAAFDPKVRHAHLELARRYDERIQKLEADQGEVPLGLVPVG